MHVALSLLVLCTTFVATTAVYCPWGPWGQWSTCSGTCGYGVQKRTRSCKEGDYCSCPSYKIDTQTRKCYRHPAKWGTWTEIGCDKKCKKTLYKRKCMHCPGDKCLGKKKKSTTPCEKNCVWSSWSTLDRDDCMLYKDKCKAKVTRTCTCDPRHCKCKGKSVKQTPCRTYDCCKCYWSGWNDITECAKNEYGRCEKKQKRQCNCNPKGCGYCDGKKEEYKTVPCADDKCCKCNWGGWNDITECAKNKYGKCEKQQKRYCNCNPKGCGNCDGKTVETKTVECAYKECCECNWGTWRREGDCVDKYGGCTQKMVRYCECNYNDCGYCDGKKKEEKYIPCDGCCDCYWSGWYDVTECAKNKDGICEKEQKRDCKCAHDYCTPCKGEDTRKVPCAYKECCECNWGGWNDITECAKNKYGKCEKQQKRYCNCNPRGCGNCDGKTVETKTVECAYKECCECNWGTWRKEGDCVDKYGECKQKMVRYCQCNYNDCGYCDGKKKEEKYITCYGCCECEWTEWKNEGACYFPDYTRDCKQRQVRHCYDCHRKPCNECKGDGKRDIDCPYGCYR